MKTKLFTLLFALLLASGAFAWDYYRVPIGDLYYNLDATTRTAEVTQAWYPQLSGAVVIPSSVTYNNIQYSVTSIGDYAFNDCTGLTSITIPESITSIGDYAFQGCTSLTAIVWNARNCTLGNWWVSHENRPQIVSFTIGNHVETIPNSLCSGMTGLTSITIPENITSIGNYAFSGCTGLTSIAWNVRNYDISDMSETPFDDLRAQITSFTFGNTCSIIPSHLCSGMSKLTSITIPESVTNIGESAFEFCSGLTSVTIPESVTSIKERTFSETGLTSIIIPNSVTSIGNYAFAVCTGLSSITIPESVTSIGNGAFSACSGLTSITVAAGNTVYDSHDNCNAIIETATNKLIRGCQNTIIPNSVTIIGDGAFSECFGLTSITIPNSVTTIEDDAFFFCDGLTSVTLGSSLKVIGCYGFQYCENIQTITCYSQRPPTVQEYGLEDVPYSTIVYVPADYLDTYKQHVTWGNYDVRPIDGSAVENVTLQGMRVEAGMLVFGEPAEVSVYTAAGVCVHSGMTERLQLPSGVYTVRCGNAACKTLIP